MHAGHSPLVIRQKIVMHIYIQLVEGGHDQYSVEVGSSMTQYYMMCYAYHPNCPF